MDARRRCFVSVIRPSKSYPRGNADRAETGRAKPHMIGLMAAYCLAIHGSYGCRHAGACCTAGWDIPIEADAARTVEVWFRGRSAERPFRAGGAPAGYAAVLSRRDDGGCVFFERRTGGSCGVHRELGEDRLPSACRHFPRVALTDRRGTFVTLSHYCPTAAELLFSNGALTSVEAPPRLSLDGTVEGLNATEALPPLLRPGILMDLEAYDAWEQAALGVLRTGRLHATDALDAIAAATARIERWVPGGTSLVDAVRGAFCEGEVRLKPDTTRTELWTLARDAVPEGLPRPERMAFRERQHREASCVLREYDAAARAYLAARLFGNWMAYHGRGLPDIVAFLQVHHAVLQVEVARRLSDDAVVDRRALLLESIRAADLLMVHLVDISRLAQLMKTLPASSFRLPASGKLSAES